MSVRKMRVLIIASHEPGTKGGYVSKGFTRLGWESYPFDDWHYGLPGRHKVKRILQGIISKLPRLEAVIIKSLTDPLFLRQVNKTKPDLIFLIRADSILVSSTSTPVFMASSFPNFRIIGETVSM